MKYATWLIFALVFTVFFALTACNGDDDDDSNDDDATIDDDAADDDAIDDDGVADDDATDDDLTDDDQTDDDATDDDATDDDATDDDATDDDATDDDTVDDDATDDDTVVTCDAVITRLPYLQNAQTGSMTIMWMTDKLGNSIVEWGPTEDLGHTVSDNEMTRMHEIVITGLQPETTYYYKAISCEDESAVSTMSTAIFEETPFTFAVYGDNRSQPEWHRAVVEKMIDAAPDIILNVGDIVASGWDFPQYEEQFFGPLADLIDHTPIYVSIGNHEAESPWYYTSFSFPEDPSAYSFTYGNVFFIAFNSNRPWTPPFPQYQWLEDTLDSQAATDAEFIVVFCHHPPYSEGWDTYEGSVAMRDTLVPLFEEKGVDVWFAGHTHDYERGHLNGVTHYITGGGGGSLDTQARDFEHIVVYESRYHFMNVTVAGDTMTLDAIDTDGVVFDTYQIEH